MANFCGNCGSKIDDDDKVCGVCGSIIEAAPSYSEVVRAIYPTKAKKLGKYIKLGIGIGVLVFALLITWNIISAFIGIKGTVRNIMNAYNDGEVDSLVEMSSDIYFYSTQEFVDEYFTDVIDGSFRTFEGTLGNNYKISYEIEDEYELPARKFNELKTELSESYPDFDTHIMQTVAYAIVSVTAKSGNESLVIKLGITLSQENNDWKLLYIDQI